MTNQQKSNRPSWCERVIQIGERPVSASGKGNGSIGEEGSVGKETAASGKRDLEFKW